MAKDEWEDRLKNGQRGTGNGERVLALGGCGRGKKGADSKLVPSRKSGGRGVSPDRAAWLIALRRNDAWGRCGDTMF
jgi:hypothetical protein